MKKFIIKIDTFNQNFSTEDKDGEEMKLLYEVEAENEDEAMGKFKSDVISIKKIK